jgi:hypothetical protein
MLRDVTGNFVLIEEHLLQRATNYILDFSYTIQALQYSSSHRQLFFKVKNYVLKHYGLEV